MLEFFLEPLFCVVCFVIDALLVRGKLRAVSLDVLSLGLFIKLVPVVVELLRSSELKWLPELVGRFDFVADVRYGPLDLVELPLSANW